MDEPELKAVDVDHLARISGIPTSTLNKLRMTPDASPPFFRIGRRVYYPLREYQAWAAARVVGGTTNG